jgi:aryl-alcohol dehydrogenase-like predicted oxidoreductase
LSFLAVHAGKVRYIGCSNIPAWRLALALGASERRMLARYDSLQPHYNLAYREEFERELCDLCVDQALGVIPYSPLAGGFLTGKYRRGDPAPESTRADGVQKRYFNERGWRVLDALAAVAAEHGAPPAQIALAWLLARPAITAPIVGANSPAQLAASMGAADLALSAEQIARLDVASDWRASAG